MPNLENLDESGAGEIDDDKDFASLESGDDDEITDRRFTTKPISSASIRKRPTGIHYSRPEPINIGNSEFGTKRRGRPPGSTNKNSKSTRTTNTNVEQFWTQIAAISLNFSTAFLAGKIFRDRKYIMTKEESYAAAKAIMVVAFKYKQFREFAVIVNTDNDFAIIARGFWPYLQRVFLQEIINNVISGLFVSGPKQSGKPVKSTGQFNGQHAVGNSQSANVQQQFSPEISGISDWRDV